MTDESRGVEAAGPPWSVDLLADLHSGVLDDGEATRLRVRVEADPEAQAILEALDATAADLAAWGSASAPPLPDAVAARIDAALVHEAQEMFGTAPVVDIAMARRRRNRRLGWLSGAVAVAAATVAAVVILVPKGTTTGGNPVAEAPPQAGQAAPLAVRGDHPEAAVGHLSTGVKDYGPLGGPERLSSCLQAAGLAANANPIGVSPGTVDGRQAVLVLLTTGWLAEFRLIAFTPSCGQGGSGVLLDKVVGK
ncbi:hypothetical protein [Amycolatopsis pigmentata]|uniref:Anti-sigma-M factor RsmA n=1 Tax=Amycolatopsis pigmentata TaxID=450801 RepID=A0ABW5FW36_9PSEU